MSGCGDVGTVEKLRFSSFQRCQDRRIPASPSNAMPESSSSPASDISVTDIIKESVTKSFTTACSSEPVDRRSASGSAVIFICCPKSGVIGVSKSEMGNSCTELNRADRARPSRPRRTGLNRAELRTHEVEAPSRRSSARFGPGRLGQLGSARLGT